MSDPKSVKLNVYLLKDGYTLGDPIIADGKMTETEVDVANAGPGLLYVTQAKPHPPDWAWFLTPVDEEAIGALRVASVSVVLIVPADNRYFAACFGHGYAHVDKRFVEARFGLRTCLNAIDPETIRTLDKRTFDSLGKLSHEQSTRPVAVTEFGLEIDKDLLRSLVGKPTDESLGKQIAGKDSVCVRIPITIGKLSSFLRKLYRESKKSTYQKHFAFIDNIAEVSDPELVASLDDELVNRINDGNVSKIWLAVPDIVNWETSSGFKYAKAKRDRVVDDIRLRDYLERWEIESDLSPEKLRKHRVFQYGNDETTVVNSWSVHHCIYGELDVNGETYILTEGAWYNVNRHFVDRVNSEYKAIPQYAKKLEDWGDEHEQHYNRRVSENSNGHYALTDRKMINHGGGASSIEFCDLISAEKEIIHVKNYSGSSVLSHLFHQGTVSAVMTAGDPSFRSKVNEYLPATHQLPKDGEFKTSDYEIVFAIGTREPLTFELPFFSKVSLGNSVRQLMVSNYRVSIARIRRSKLTKIA